MKIRSLLGCFVAALVLVSAFGYFPASAGEIPDLTGKWTGTWSGQMDHRMDMNVKKQEGATISGTITYYTWDGSTYYHGMRGELKSKKDKLVLSVKITSGSGKFTFTYVTLNRLEGRGESVNHEGPVTLKRSGSTKKAE